MRRKTYVRLCAEIEAVTELALGALAAQMIALQRRVEPCWNEFTPRRRNRGHYETTFSEAQFNTLKYRPASPERFGSIQDARAHCHVFFPWYNTEHHHAGVGLLTPFDVAAWRLGHEVSPVPGGERRGRAFLRGLWRPVEAACPSCGTPVTPGKKFLPVLRRRAHRRASGPLRQPRFLHAKTPRGAHSHLEGRARGRAQASDRALRRPQRLDAQSFGRARVLSKRGRNEGMGIKRTARTVGVGVATVQRIKAAS